MNPRAYEVFAIDSFRKFLYPTLRAWRSLFRDGGSRNCSDRKSARNQGKVLDDPRYKMTIMQTATLIVRKRCFVLSITANLPAFSIRRVDRAGPLNRDGDS